jgi:predicted chitinase
MPDELASAKALLRAEMDRQGMHNNELRAGTAAIAMGESGFDSRSETPYRNTSNSRIRATFRSRLGDKSDAFINDLKASDERFFNYVYGPQFNHIHHLGQVEPDDGWRFRGHGTVQLTGRSNHEKLKTLTGHDIVSDPELANKPEVAAAITVAYMLWRYNGGGWQKMKDAVGISFGDVDERKNVAFDLFWRTGEFNYRPGAQEAPPAPATAPVAAIAPLDAIRALQTTLRDAGYYRAEIDGDFGRLSRAALNELLAAAGQPRV